MRNFDAAVLGLGTMGSFACLELARRGLRVAGFDQFHPPHSRGSHSGDTRVFRVAYSEHPDYVPLAQRAGELWDRHSLNFGAPLLTRSGMLSMGPSGGDLISGIRLSVRTHNLPIEELTAGEIRLRYPGLAPPDSYCGVFEAAAGWIDVQAAIAGALTAAEKHGATLLRETPVTAWREQNGRIAIETPNEIFEAERLIISAGAWAGVALRELRLPLVVRRKTLAWVEPATPELFAPGRFPIFAIADRFFYGFPNIAGQGVKLAVHWEEGEIVTDPSQPLAPPDESDLSPVMDLASRYLPKLTGGSCEGLARIRRAATCLYTMTPDEHFIIDRHPHASNVWMAAGFSGHGFKFAPAVGEALADLSVNGRTELPIGFLGAGRFHGAARDVKFKT